MIAVIKNKRPDDMVEEVDEAHGEQQDPRTLIVLMSGTDSLSGNN